MEFNTVPDPMERKYYHSPDFDADPTPKTQEIEGVIKMRDVGQSVAEGQRFGTFVQSTQNAIKAGAGKIELATNMGGGQEPVGAEAYGKDARQALREIFKVNKAEVTSVHTPVQVGNLSGYNPQERGFSDEHRKMGMDEINKAIDFASDVSGGAVVVHTGEYQRDISDQPWAKNPDGSFKFLGYNEEPGKAVLYMVDDRTGKMITEVRKNQIVHEPKFQTKYDPVQKRERWIDKDGNFLDENNIDDLFNRVPEWDDKKTRFKTNGLVWDDFVKRANEWNTWYKKENGNEWTPEEMYWRSQMETRILQARGSSLYHGRFYSEEKKAREELLDLKKYFEKVEKNTPIEQQWKLLEERYSSGQQAGQSHMLNQYGKKKHMLPTQAIEEEINRMDLSMRYIHEASSSADAQASETTEALRHMIPVAQYAKKVSMNSLAEAGIHAMERTHNNPHAKKDVFVAPENIFPEMGYGSHPDELIELVHGARKNMVERLTAKRIEDPHQRRDREGNVKIIDNPDYTGIGKQEAEKMANQHIKATLDTQHLSMWWKHFQPKPGETKAQRKSRFDKWYMNQIEKLEKSDVIGHIHIVDAMGGGHQHLPVGQGVFPVREAVEYLKKKGYGGTMISEAHGEDGMFGQGRILTEAWKGLGVPIKSVGYGIGGPTREWSDVQHSYFGVAQNPYFIFGAYSPSNDWQLWSQVPME